MDQFMQIFDIKANKQEAVKKTIKKVFTKEELKEGEDLPF